jgi:hypothetical protein
MTTITVPTYDEVSPANRAIFDNLKSRLGFVPNLYATFAHSASALASYLALQQPVVQANPNHEQLLASPDPMFRVEGGKLAEHWDAAPKR